MNIDLEKHSFNYTPHAPHTSSQSSQASSFASAGWSFASTNSSPASSQEEAATDYAFLVHSQSSVFANLPPIIDNKTFARQKRKRTSPEDQSILESEFQKNSKPDRHARRDIVSRVALSDREVQIWFQNRRQTARRKSQPLTTDAAIDSQLSSGAECATAVTKDEEKGSREIVTPLERAPVAGADSRVTETRINGESNSYQSLGISQDEAQSDASIERAKPKDDEILISETLGQSAQPVITQPRPSPQLLRRTSSHLRLSTTSDGTAKVLTADDASPPKRAYAEVDGSLLEDPVLEPRRLFQRVPSGRSRDSRAWEFWCDVENRNGLLKKAEEFQTGSAADAISLLRSNQRNISVSNQAKPSATFSRARRDQQGNKKRRNFERHVGLNRAISSNARLQHHSSQNTKRNFLGNEGNVRAKFNKGDSKGEMSICKASSGDSDKENREPAGAAAVVTQAASRQAQDRALKGPPRLLSSRTAPAHHRHRNNFGIYEDTDKMEVKASHPKQERVFNPEQDEEISSFMKSGRKEEADMDCIRGLLSLSQGMWQ